LVAAVMALAWCCEVRADFSPPELVTDGTGRTTQCAIGIDLGNRAYIACVIDERIVVRVIGPGINLEIPIGAEGLGQGDPDFATSSTGITHMIFSQLDSVSSGEGREIYYTRNAGGGFKPPRNISVSRVDDFAPRLVLDREGQPHVVYAQRVQTESRVMYWNEGLEAGVFAVMGDYPSLFVDEAGIVHLIYMRDSDIYYNHNGGGSFDNETPVTTTPSEKESSAQIGGDVRGNLLICYESRNSIYFTTNDRAGGGFKTPSLLERGTQDPNLRMQRNGQVAIAYVKGGDLYYVYGLPTVIGFARRNLIKETQAVESLPGVEIDLLGNIHVSFLRNRDGYYTNNAATPTADFSAEPTMGEAPLTVRFGDLSSGAVQRWEWDFGDGGTSSQSEPVYTYTAPGKYTVKLKVLSAGNLESVVQKVDFIVAQTPYNMLRIPDQKVFPGEKGVWFPVLASHLEPIKGFQLMGTYDPSILQIKAFELANTVVQPLDPDFTSFRDRETYFEVGVIFELCLAPPPACEIGDTVLPAGENQTILNLVFDVAETAPIGETSKVELANNLALSDILTVFTLPTNFSVFPALTPSTVEIVPPDSEPLFQRGDTDSNGIIEITDAIKMLNYLFLGQPAPRCRDAADFNDAGRIDITSPIALLNFLFLGGAQPAVPYPNKGYDPTPDTLETCRP
jgi:PKD repeat protein